MESSEWTLEELGDRVRAALSVDYQPAGSARVRAVPDPRTIRYYTTLGLVARPELRGRTALYGRRHLAQLVAIKRLQADGLSLGEVQARLAGLPDVELERLARLPGDGVGELPTPDAAAASAPPEAAAERRSFWAEEPAPPPPPAVTEAPPPPLSGVELAPGVALSFPAARPLTGDERRTLAQLARPLLDHLSSLGLLPSAPRLDEGDAP